MSQTDQGRVYPGQETGQTQPPFFPTSNTPVLDRVLFKMLEYTVTTKHCQAPAGRENHSHRGEQASSRWDPQSPQSPSCSSGTLAGRPEQSRGQRRQAVWVVGKALCTQPGAPRMVWGKGVTPLDAHVRMTSRSWRPPALSHACSARHTARSSAAPWSEAPYPPAGCSALEADSAAWPLSDPGAGLGVPGSHQVGSRIPPHHWGKLPKPLPVSRPADEPAFLLPSSRQGPGALSSLRGRCEPTADQARSHPAPASV